MSDPQPIVTLTITMDNTGQVSVNGPLENRVLCYGLLETARDTIADFAKKQEKSGIVGVVANFQLPGS